MINKTQYNGVTVLFRGTLPTNTQDFIQDVCRGVKPRGNYGSVVVLSDNERYYVTDHFSTYPIWYNQNDYDFFYQDIAKRTEIKTKEESFYNERKVMGGFTVSDMSPFKEIKRVPIDSIVHVKDGETKIIKHDTLIDSSVSSNGVEEVKTNFENFIAKNCAEKNVLFLSGGKDSTTIAHVVKKLGLANKFRFLSLWSPKAKQHEKEPVSRIAIHLDIPVEFIEVEYSGRIFDDETNARFFDFWTENTYSAKRKAIMDLGLTDSLCWSGEVGVGNMQSRYVLQYYAQKGYQKDKLARFSVNICGTHRRSASVTDHALEYLDTPTEYERCVNHFESVLDNFDRHPDVINRILFHRLKDESAFRVYAYSQDDKINWIHPFTNFNFINSCINWPSSIKFVNDRDKNIYRLLWPEMTTIPWEYAKSGLGIPASSKYNAN